MIKFDVTAADARRVSKIVSRYADLGRNTGRGMSRAERLDVRMDLIATHANGCPMDFAKLMAADDFTLLHDIAGIRRHLDRDDESPTGGQLVGLFLPRCAQKEPRP